MDLKFSKMYIFMKKQNFDLMDNPKYKYFVNAEKKIIK